MQYLDWRSSPSLTEDNQDFVDNSATNGFIEGPVFDAQGNLIINDKLAVITYENLMTLLEKRVVGEVLACLRDYSALPGNNARYPWAANVAWPNPPILSDEHGRRFGRVPDEPFSKTKLDIGGPTTSDTWLPDECKPPQLATCTVPVQCKITSRSSSKTWWLNWKEHVFYAVAEAYQPAAGSPSPCGLLKSCLRVYPPSPVADRQVAVIAAGKRLAGVAGGQLRSSGTDKGIVSNYLEDDNATQSSVSPHTDNSFTAAPTTATFNDVVCKQGIC